MQRHAWLAVFAVLFFSIITNSAFADNRVALVIGNGAYAHAAHLPNPPHDADDVAAALKRTGFQTIVGIDLDQAGMQNAAIRFSRAARNADVAVFYYSGHAMQYAGVNYLVPIDAKLHDEADLRRMARVDDILGDLQQAKNLRILVLDSCRDNPLADELKRSMGRTRSASIGRGLAKMESPNGTIISYSTQAGGTAMDGDGRNSPYTRAFLKHIEDKEEVSTVFHRISASVYESTSGEQTPELSLSFFGEFYLNGKLQITVAPTTTPAPTDPCAATSEHWISVEAIGTIDAYQDHLARFPNCAFAGLAKVKIASLSSKAAVATPPAAPTAPSTVLNTLRSAVAALYLDNQPAGVMTNRGRAYEDGRGVVQDYAEARKWYEKAAAANDPVAMALLGALYKNGKGVAQDYAEARKWYEKAAAANEPFSMNNLGVFHENGQGVTKDYAEARKWYEKAAAANNPYGMTNLGRIYENGLGVAQDFTEARKWYEKAAAIGSAQASASLVTLNARAEKNMKKP